MTQPYTQATTRQAAGPAMRQDQPLARRDEPQPDQPMMTKASADEQQRMIEDLRHMQRLPKDAQEHEIAYFAEVCRRTGLSPFSMPPQIYMVARWDNKLNRNACTIQTGIDGYRLVSDDRIDGMDAPVFAYSEDGQVISATCTVYRKGCSRPFSATAYYDEYVQTTKDGKPTSMWRDKPHVMLAKCAEALVRRMAFPMLLSGLYTAEEMAQAENPVVATVEPQAPRREAPAVLRALPDPEPEVVRTAAPAAKPPAALAPVKQAQADNGTQPAKAAKDTPWGAISRVWATNQGVLKCNMAIFAWHVARVADMNPGDQADNDNIKALLDQAAAKGDGRIDAAVKSMLKEARAGVTIDSVSTLAEQGWGVPPASATAAGAN